MKRAATRTGLLAVGVALIGLMSAASLPAQDTGVVHGRVVNEDGGSLGGAQISLVGTTRGGLTNAEGRYQLVGVPTGTYTVRAQSLGYRTREATVTVEAGERVEQNFTLAEEAIALREVAVTIGSRASHSAADELAVPVDVFPRVELEATAQVETAGMLQELSPAVNFPRPQIADITSGVRPFQLRGLSPDHSLVLVNGKRRHPTAVVHVFGASALTPGSSGVDMNAIAGQAIGQMEILRDGAAAQYGSDAIAGVVNLQLRSDVHAPEFQVSYGRYAPNNWPSDGRRFNISGSWGIALGDRGTLNITATAGDRQPTQRGGPDPRDQTCVGDPDIIGDCDGDVVEDIDGDGVNEIVEKRNDVPQPNHLDGDGAYRNYRLFWNGVLDVGDNGMEAYNFGGFSRRRDLHSGFYRRALDGRNWPGIHPLGFLPTFRAVTRDISVTTGLRGQLSEWNWDLSGQFGQNRLDNTISNTLNASLGPCLDQACAPGADGQLNTDDDPGIPNSTAFYAGALELNQYLLNLDVTRLVDMARFAPVNVAFGLSLRRDNYKVIAGEKGSYVNGYHENQNGGIAAPGAQVFQGYRPSQEADASRNNVGAYLELESDVTDWFLISTATRFENYTDFGQTLTEKVALRLQPAEQFVLRAAASTGFRAPALSQGYYTHTSTGFQATESGNQIAYEIGEFPVHSPEAQALGAEPLKEEKSRNISAGFAYTPTENLNITADAYGIDVDDRIILTGSMSGETVENLLSEYQASAVKFFTNAIDTRTYGVDVTARYRYLFDDDQFLETVFAYNYNQQRVRDVHVPDVIAELEDQVFDAFDRKVFEEGRPRDRFTGKAMYTHGDFRVRLGANYYGEITTMLQELPEVLNTYSAKTLTDIEASYRFLDRFELSVGSENVFDVFPDPIPEGYNFLGIFPYSGTSGFGYNGRYIFTRLRASF